MKIKVKTLRKLIREGIISELSISPAFFRNEKLTATDPMKNSNLVKTLDDIERNFNSALMNSLIYAHANAYDSDTRDFDDKTYENLKNLADEATKNAMSKLSSTLQNVWSQVLKTDSGDNHEN